MYQNVFKRYEKKYLLNEQQYTGLMNALSYNTEPDKYGESLVCNIYYDTPDYRLIRASLEKPVYKEKLRLRCYGVPTDSTGCFIELKKKYKGIVYKRRVTAPYKTALGYLAGKEYNLKSEQISQEIDYFISFYSGIQPSAALFYDRTALYDRSDENLRLTFDSRIVYRNYDLDLRNGVYGTPLLEPGLHLLEIKTAHSFPLWLTRILDELKIYPATFSKYGAAYTDMMRHPEESNGGIYCA